MSVLVVANDVPVPPNSGGRIDVWRRLNLLKSLKVRTALLCWYDGSEIDEAPLGVRRALATVCETTMLVPVKREVGELAGRLLRAWRVPSHAASRWVTVERRALLRWAREFGPRVILLDGLYGAACACWLATQLKRPLLYRSHNVEHVYMQRQLECATSWRRRVAVTVSLLGLERFESRVIARADRVLDISLEDQRYWRKQGFDHVEWLPPLVDAEYAESVSQPDPPRWDAMYFGNLNTPNNVDALRWLVESVLPLLPVAGLRVAVAGSSPTAEVEALLRRDQRVTLISDPEDMAPVARRARVLVNPMRVGSGVSIKSVEMLFSRAPLVSTSVGVRGLPVEARACFSVRDDAAGFAEAVQRGLTGETLVALDERQQARRPFTPAAVGYRMQDVFSSVLTPP